MWNHQVIQKPLGHRVVELSQSLQVIRDSIQSVRQGKLHQFIPLYGQLRSLLSEKSKKNKPLLLDLASQIGQPLQLFCMPSPSEAGFPERLKEGMILHVAGFPVALEKQLPGQTMVPLEQFLDHEIVQYKSRGYSVRDIITFFANKAGGSHFSPDLPKDFAEIMSFGLFGQPIVTNALLQIGEVTFALGLRLLKSVIEFELHALVFIPEQEIKERAFLLDYGYPGTPMRIFCFLDHLQKVHFGATGYNGPTGIASVQHLLDWSKPHHLMLALEIADDLSTNLNILVDGDDVAKQRVEIPLVVANDPLHYDGWINRSIKDEQAGCTFCMGEIAMYGRDLPVKERAKMLLYMNQSLSSENQPCFLFRRGNYGHMPPGTKDLTIVGKVVEWNMARAVQGQFPLVDG